MSCTLTDLEISEVEGSWGSEGWWFIFGRASGIWVNGSIGIFLAPAVQLR